MPALIIVALSVPTPGTTRSSTRFPVGNIAPPPSPSPSSAGSMNSSCTSAAGNVTPSSSKSPVSCTAPFVIGTCATMVLPMFTCQMRTTATPSFGTRLASTRPFADRERPDGRGEIAAVAAPVHERLVDRDLAEQVVDVVIRPRALRQDHRLAGARGGSAHAVDLLAVRVRAADHAQQQRITRRARHLRGLGQVLQAEEHALAGTAAHVGGGNADLRRGNRGHSPISLQRK